MNPPTAAYCTYFDRGFLPQGLALWRSLARHEPAAELWVLALDEFTAGVLRELGDPKLHVVSLAEAEYIYETGAERRIVGAGQNGMVELSPEAAEYFAGHEVEVDLSPTPEALARWNEARGKVIGLFHVTC